MYNVYAYRVQCLSTSIAYCSRAFLFFPSFTLSPSSLSSLFFHSFLSYIFPFFLSCPLPYLPSFHYTFSSFPTPPFIPTSPFPPLFSSIISPLLSFRLLFSLLASFPSNPLFLSYSSINPTPSFFYPFILSHHSFPSYPSFSSYPSFPSYPSIPSYSLLPLHFFLSLHSFLSLLHIIPLFSFLSLLLYLPFFHIPLSLFATFSSPASFLFSPFFPSSPSFPPLLPFQPLHSFLHYNHSFLPLLYLLASFPSSPFVIFLPLLLFLPLLNFHFHFPFPTHIPFLPFLPFLPHLYILLVLSFPSPSFHRPPSLSSILALSSC